MMDNKTKDYELLCQDVMKCAKCDLGCEKILDGFNPHVMGQGNINAKIMFIAEAPGFQETKFGKPLTPPGTSGVIYEKVLSALGLTRDEVYTTNTVLCRPPKNRDPEPWEVHKCRNNLKRQIELVKPKIIVTFGRFAAQAFINDFKITRDHGKLRKSEIYGVNIFPLYHPAYIGAYAPKDKREEFKVALKALKNILDNYDGILE
jgi:uracil-DNA glycosylase